MLEVYSKNQIIQLTAAIKQKIDAASDQVKQDVQALIDGLQPESGAGTSNVWTGTQVEYDALSAIDPNTLYFADNNGTVSAYIGSLKYSEYTNEAPEKPIVVPDKTTVVFEKNNTEGANSNLVVTGISSELWVVLDQNGDIIASSDGVAHKSVQINNRGFVHTVNPAQGTTETYSYVYDKGIEFKGAIALGDVISVDQFLHVRGGIKFAITGDGLLNVPQSLPITLTDMGNMFFKNTCYISDNISLWNTSNVENMGAVFYGASKFNQDIGGWDVSSVTNMWGLFESAASFNQDLSKWCVTNISSEPQRFSSYGASFAKPVWGTCPRGENAA